MRTITYELERKPDGTKITKTFFVYDNQGNILANAQKDFSKDEKKQAKLNYKNSLKNKSLHQQKRVELVEQIIKQPFPKWNIKLSFLSC